MFSLSFIFSMVILRVGGYGSSAGSSRLGGPGSSDRNIDDIIVAEVLRFILERLPGLFNMIKDKLIMMMDEQFRTIRLICRPVGQRLVSSPFMSSMLMVLLCSLEGRRKSSTYVGSSIWSVPSLPTFVRPRLRSCL